MDCNYDEDLNENQFFRVLQSEQPELFQQATLEGWVICVPRAGSLPKYSLTDEDFFNHILIPSDELPESHFRSLNDKEVRVCNRVISVENETLPKPFNVNILFEETFYTDDLFKYKVLCVESPLEPRSCNNRVSDLGLVNLQTLRDCIDLLWTESVGKEVMEQLDQANFAFKESHPDLENESFQTQRDLVNGLYLHCVQIAMKDPFLKEKSSNNKHLLSNIKLAVETYMQHGIYKNVIKGITALTAHEDEQLNKIIRNSSELQLRDLEVRADLYETVPLAKQELAHIDCYSTVLGKIGCIRRALGAVSGEQLVCADDLLPVLIFLVIKVSLPNWMAHLTMMKDFRFSSQDQDESSFLVTSLEAAIEHIKSGCLFRPSCPESQFEENENLMLNQNCNKSTIEYLFNQVKLGNEQQVKEIIDKNCESPRPLEETSSLCHPLCSCDKCEGELLKQQTNITPTLHCNDEQGQTALHIACRYGQLSVVELLIDQGARINVKDLRGCTPLHHAASGGHQNALLLLLHKNASGDVTDSDGNTPLHFASSSGHEACVKALLYFSEHLGQPVKVEAKNVHGDTPLHHASRWGFIGIVQILLEYGARPDIKNNRRVSPMDCAHSIHVSKLLSTLMIPPRKGSNKKVSFLKIKVAAASKSTLDFTEQTLTGKFSGAANEETLEYGVRPRSLAQCKKVIFGPMFSGKTTELIRRMKRYQVAQYRCLVFKYAGDNRYDDSQVASHDHQKLSAVSTSTLSDHMALASTFDVLGIDEGQFFPDTVEFCERMADLGKLVVVAALDGTYQRQGFGNILQLVPLAESVEKLTAVCMMCLSNASYTKRIGSEQEVEVIGGADKYMAVCRQCYHKTTPTLSSPFKNLTNVQDTTALDSKVEHARRVLM